MYQNANYLRNWTFGTRLEVSSCGKHAQTNGSGWKTSEALWPILDFEILTIFGHLTKMTPPNFAELFANVSLGRPSVDVAFEQAARAGKKRYLGASADHSSSINISNSRERSMQFSWKPLLSSHKTLLVHANEAELWPNERY